MSLIIPDLSMPKCCIECPCYYDGYCCAFEDSKNVDYETGDKKKMEFCPLIEVNESGAIKALEQQPSEDCISRNHTCGRCRWGELSDEFYPCNKCIHSADKREDFWQYAESEDKE